jgi:hypothetical protein
MGVAPRRGDEGHTTADQISHQRRQAIVLAVQPVILHRHVLAIDVPTFAKALAECSRIASEGNRRSAADEPDHRHLCLLRTRRELPCRRAKPRDERPPSHLWSLALMGGAYRGAGCKGTGAPCARMPRHARAKAAHASRGAPGRVDLVAYWITSSAAASSASGTSIRRALAKGGRECNSAGTRTWERSRLCRRSAMPCVLGTSRWSLCPPVAGTARSAGPLTDAPLAQRQQCDNGNGT